MDPRRRKVLEGLLKSHRKSDRSLHSINIIDIDSLCNSSMLLHTNMYEDISSLEAKTKHLKEVIDKYDLTDCYRSDYYKMSNYYSMVRDLPIVVMSNWTQKEFVIRSKRFLYQSNIIRKGIKQIIEEMNKKLRFLLEENLNKHYIKRKIWDCESREWRISKVGDLAINQLRKFEQVCKFIPPKYNIEYPEDWKVYLCYVELLNYCCKIELSDSECVVNIIKIIIKMHFSTSKAVESALGTCTFRQPTYSSNFFKYILNHISDNKFDLQDYMSQNLNTVWEYANKFSILDAMVCGDESRTRTLLQHGFHIFPEYESRKNGHGFLNVLDTIPWTHRLILEAMKKIKLRCFNSEIHNVIMSSSQKKCFELIWEEVPEFFVTSRELYTSIKKEKDLLLLNNMNENQCFDRWFDNHWLVDVYIKNFKDIALSSKPNKVFRYVLNMQYEIKKR